MKPKRRPEPSSASPRWERGAPGFGQTQKLTGNAVLDHWPAQCAACEEPFGPLGGGYDEVEVLPADANALGLAATAEGVTRGACVICHNPFPYTQLTPEPPRR